jgi:hypothetical protein
MIVAQPDNYGSRTLRSRFLRITRDECILAIRSNGHDDHENDDQDQEHVDQGRDVHFGLSAGECHSSPPALIDNPHVPNVPAAQQHK